MTRKEAQTALDAAVASQTAARAALAAAVAAVNNAKADVLDADAKVMSARAALTRLGGPVTLSGGTKTGQSDLSAAVTKVLQTSGTTMTVDQIITALQGEGVALSGTKPRENLNAYLARWSKVPGATIVNKGRGLWGAAGAPEVPAFLAPVQPDAPAVENEVVDVPAFLTPATEVEAPEVPADLLPEGFPGLSALMDAGLTTRSSLVDKTHDQLRRIKGVGAQTARDILSALNPSEA